MSDKGLLVFLDGRWQDIPQDEMPTCDMCGVSGGAHRRGCPEDDTEPSEAEKAAHAAGAAAERARVVALIEAELSQSNVVVGDDAVAFAQWILRQVRQ